MRQAQELIAASISSICVTRWNRLLSCAGGMFLRPAGSSSLGCRPSLPVCLCFSVHSLPSYLHHICMYTASDDSAEKVFMKLRSMRSKAAAALAARRDSADAQQ